MSTTAAPTDEVTVSAHAKLNLFLRVHAPRSDGYHELESLILPLSLADRMTFRRLPGAPGVQLHVATEHGGDLSAGPDNLVAVAAQALSDACLPGDGVEIELVKRIPLAAGMGGGSADAAATLRVLADLWQCGASEEELLAVAATIGSDVPPLLMGGPVMVRGRGEIVEPTPVRGVFHFVVVPAGFPLRTPDAFAWWGKDGGPVADGDTSTLLAAVRAGDTVALGSAMFNDLERPVFARHPELARTRDTLQSLGAVGVVMCGSGPTMAGLFRGAEAASAAAAVIPGSISVIGPPPSSV